MVPDVTYLWNGKLDVYQALAANTPNPTLISFHADPVLPARKSSASLGRLMRPMFPTGSRPSRAGKHGACSDPERTMARAEIRDFLDKKTMIRDTAH